MHCVRVLLFSVALWFAPVVAQETPHVEPEITEEELEIAKQKLIAIHAQSDTTIGEQASQQALNLLHGFGINYDKTYEARVEAVTMEDVKAAAAKYLTRPYLQVTTSNLKKEENQKDQK